MKSQKSKCCTCGFEWTSGTDGSHSCSAILRKKLVNYKKALSDLTHAVRQETSANKPCTELTQTAKALNAAMELLNKA